MAKATDDAKNLEKLLRELKKKETDTAAKEIEGVYTTLQNDCKSCHKSYRNSKPK